MALQKALSGMTPRELSKLRSLSPPWKLQRFLDDLAYDIAGSGCRSPRRVLRERTAQCMDGALFAAAAFRSQGERPLILDLEAEQDDDHVLSLFRYRGAWGALARSNYSGLRFREPIYRTIRDLALSYVESYFNLRRQKTLRRVSRPIDLSRFDSIDWMTTEKDLWAIPEYLVTVPHSPLFRRDQIVRLSPVDRRMFEAGKVGREERPAARAKTRG